MKRLLMRGCWNSGLLSLWFLSLTLGGYSSGSYLTVAMGAFCFYISVSEALMFYKESGSFDEKYQEKKKEVSNG